MLEQILPYLTIVNVLSGLTLFFTVYNLASYYLIEKPKIARLGGSAPRHQYYLPFGIDVAYKSIWYTKKNREYELWTDMFRRWGRGPSPYTFEFRIAGDRIIFTAEPDNVKAILATQFGDYGKGKDFNNEWHPFLGDSIFSTDGRLWHDSRQLIRPQFAKDRVSDLKCFERHVKLLVGLIDGSGGVAGAEKDGGMEGRTVDVVDLFYRLTLDVSTEFLLGRSVGSLLNPQVKFAKAFQHVQHVHTIKSRAGKFQALLPKGSYYEDLRTINSFVHTYIEEALSLPQDELEKRSKADEGYTFLHAIAGYTRDRDMLRDQLVAVLLAGRDTTACTLSWLFYELSKHPQVVKKLRQEVQDVVGIEGSPVPTYESLKGMRYLQHTLNETLRLYPIVPYNIRVALKDTTLPRGGGPDGLDPVGVLKNTRIGYSTLVMQRRPELYPSPSTGFPPVEEFVPERWENWTPRAWTYIPFNGGPRICVGQQFALTEMAYVVVRLLQRYKRVENRMPIVGPNGERKVPGMSSDIVLQPLGGAYVSFIEDDGTATATATATEEIGEKQGLV